MLHRSFLAMADAQSGEAQPQHHDDQRAADAVNALALAPHRAGLWARLVPAALRAAFARSAADRMLARSIARLSETSPHLLEDVGVTLAPDLPTTATHTAHLQADVAIEPDASFPAARAAPPVRSTTVGRDALAPAVQ